MYVGCPVLWFSKLQTEIDLSTPEAENITLIQTIHDVIPFMVLIKEISFIFDFNLQNPEEFYKLV